MVVLFYQENDGMVPLLEWLDRLSPKIQAKCVARLKRLETSAMGYVDLKPTTSEMGFMSFGPALVG
jgi:hypothetical protein